MKDIIQPIDRDILIQELKTQQFIKTSKKGDFDIYIVKVGEAPRVLQEIGRLRELSFRDAGGGTGLEVDIDEHDQSYSQLILWDPSAQEVVGGYRFILGRDAKKDEDVYDLSTANYFHFSEVFRKKILPLTIELGRSWIQPNYQYRSDNRRSIFALSSLWDGLGALLNLYPNVEYFFGKVTMYPHYHRDARNLLLQFMAYYFGDHTLAHPIYPLDIDYDGAKFEENFGKMPYDQGIKKLKKDLRVWGESIPPLINLYMGLSDTMKCFGTAVNPEFGGVEETAILVTIEDIDAEKRARHT